MRLEKLDRPINLDHDHVLGPPDAELTLVEYGSYACPYCHAVHESIAGLRNRFGDRMRYRLRVDAKLVESSIQGALGRSQHVSNGFGIFPADNVRSQPDPGIQSE